MPSVAIVTARSPAGVQGGAERLYEGLVQAFASAGWEAEEVPLAFDETSQEAILAGYDAARRLNVLMYDLVVSTKAPTYCLMHPNHAVWLVHTIRVFYDKFEEALAGEPWAQAARRRIQDLDTAALGRDGLRRFSIGQTVSDRLARYNGLDAVALHPPHPDAARFRPRPLLAAESGETAYLFTASRLHRWKRVDLIVRAVLRMDRRVRLLVAGEGPELAALRELARGHDNIEFLGFVEDERLPALYAGALAVPFVPTDEDYGYVAIEAFLSGTPVVTVADAGEPARIVAQSGGGVVCESEPAALARALDAVCSEPGRARLLGEAGRRWADTLSWTNIVETLSHG